MTRSLIVLAHVDADALVNLEYVFFFQAEDGIRDLTVTGVQTCALPIYGVATVHGVEPTPALDGEQEERPGRLERLLETDPAATHTRDLEVPLELPGAKIGRASCRERV